MKRKVKYYIKKKDGVVYKQAWIGFGYRRANGTPDFKREISLAGYDEKTIAAIDLALRSNGNLGSIGKVSFEKSLNIGSAWAAYCVAENLGIVEELSFLGKRDANIILSMILDRVISPKAHSKLGLWEMLPGSAIERVVAPDCGISNKLQDHYRAISKLFKNQNQIEKNLFLRRESANTQMFLYDITSSYFEGECCELADFGYNRDGKKGKKQIVIGLLTDSDGRPLSVEVFQGNTSDQTTVMQRIDSMRKDFNIDEMVFVGDRGMLTNARRNDLAKEDYEKVKHITALTRNEFHKFLEDQNHPLQMSLFDRQNLVEVYDSENKTRYIMSFNPEKELEDAETRKQLIAKTVEKLQLLKNNVDNGLIKDREKIAKRLYKWLNKWKMEKFFNVEFDKNKFTYSLNQDLIQAYEKLDGFYVLTTDVDAETLNTKGVHQRYKSLAQVEQAFRTMKTTELFLRPIRHWSKDRVKGHVFLCMLSYLIIWEARRKLIDFIQNEPVKGKLANEPLNNCHSLRTIWERLDQHMQIGTIKIGGTSQEQLNPIPESARQILKALDANPTPKKVTRLALVG